MKPEITLLSKFAKGKLPSAVGYFNKNCVVYTRVSTKEQSENNKSLEWQKSTCEKFAIDNGMNIIGYFGGTYESAKSDERKEFNRMLKFVRQSKKISYIVVYSLDRFSRTGDSAIYISSELKKSGVNILSATQQIDTDSVSGSFQQNIQFLFSKYDNDQRRQKSIDGMREKLLRGEWIGVPPIGYSYDHNAKEQTILINKDGVHVRQAFLMRADGIGYPEIVEYLKKHNIKAYKQMLSKMFRNLFYCGYISHNLLNGRVVRGKHKPLISEELFLKVNGELKTDGYRQNKAQDELPLKGFVRDYKTQEKFTGYLSKKKKIYYYKVNKKGVRVNRSQKLMHEIFMKELENYIIDPKMIPVFIDNILLSWASMKENVLGDKISLAKQIKQLEENISKAEMRHAIGEVNADIFNRTVSKLLDEKAKLEETLREFEFELSNPQEAIDFLMELRLDPSILWTSGDYYQKQRYQELVFPGGIWFDAENNTYRTKEVNDAFLQKPEGTRPPDENKEGTPHLVDEKSLSVPRKRLVPKHRDPRLANRYKKRT